MAPSAVNSQLRGAIAQLGERLLCKQEVAGSIPAGSTSSWDSLALAFPSRHHRANAPRANVTNDRLGVVCVHDRDLLRRVPHSLIVGSARPRASAGCSHRRACSSSLSALSCAACARSCAAWRRNCAAWRCTSRASPRSARRLLAAAAVEPAGAVPSCPLELIDHGLGRPGDRHAETPARNAAVWVPGVPIRILPASPATPVLAISMLLAPVVRFDARGVAHRDVRRARGVCQQRVGARRRCSSSRCCD